MFDFVFSTLSAPDFLNIFGLLVFVVLSITAGAIYLADRTGQQSPAIQNAPDAMEVAYLAGGLSQVIRTLIYDLDERGYVTLEQETRIKRTEKDKETSSLSNLELRLLKKLETAPKAQEIFDDQILRQDLMRLLLPVHARLDAQKLLQPASVRHVRRLMEGLSTAAILSFAGFKLSILLADGRSNISYLLFLVLAAIALVFALGYAATRRVASRCGRAYLAKMQDAFKHKLDESLEMIRSPGPQARAFSGAALYLIGLYGLDVLKGTTEAKFAETFEGVAGDRDE